MKDNTLALPCLRGIIGDWVYYSTIIPFSEVNRIDNNHQIKEDIELDRWLQRELGSRVNNIREYLLKEDQRFFNSIIIGVYGEIPDWYSLDISILAKNYNVEVSENVSNSLGVLTLSGKEILFTIDGQHRIEGIKRAIAEDADRFEKDEISVIFVGHTDDEKGFIRTRNLFATINREAKQPTANDLAIIDETYAKNIIARQIYAEYAPLRNKIVLTPTYNLDRSEHKYFTNLLSLVEVNKVLIKISGYRQSRFSSPSIEQRKRLFELVTEFYNFIFENIDEYKRYFQKNESLDKFRNASKGLPLNLVFLPIGLSFLAELYSFYKQAGKLDLLKRKINLLNFDLYEGHYKNIFFNPIQNKVIPAAHKSLAKNLTLYLLGETPPDTLESLKKKLAKAYNINELAPEFVSLKLPDKL